MHTKDHPHVDSYYSSSGRRFYCFHPYAPVRKGKKSRRRRCRNNVPFLPKVPSTMPENDCTSIENLKFYQKRIAMPGCRLKWDQFIATKGHDYDFLESRHDYIQVLFPLRKRGLNFNQQPLTKHEAEEMRHSPDIQRRILISYKMMLRFYGMHLKRESTGEVMLSCNWKERFENLNQHEHNFMRISRILKCLGIVGLEYLKKPFLQFVLRQHLQQGQLPKIRTSLLHYWIPTLRYERDLIEVEDEVRAYTGKCIPRSKYDKECLSINWSNPVFPIEPQKWKDKSFLDVEPNES